MKQKKEGFWIFYDTLHPLIFLTDAEAGEVIKAAYRYAKRGEAEPETFTDGQKEAFADIKQRVDEGIAYEETQSAQGLYGRFLKTVPGWASASEEQRETIKAKIPFEVWRMNGAPAVYKEPENNPHENNRAADHAATISNNDLHKKAAEKRGEI